MFLEVVQNFSIKLIIFLEIVAFSWFVDFFELFFSV